MQASYYGSSQDQKQLSIEVRNDHIKMTNDIIAEYMKNLKKTDSAFIVGDFNVNSYRGSFQEVFYIKIYIKII